MGLGVSLILIAVGAVLAWAVHVSSSGIDIRAVGVILLIVGLGTKEGGREPSLFPTSFESLRPRPT